MDCIRNGASAKTLRTVLAAVLLFALGAGVGALAQRALSPSRHPRQDFVERREGQKKLINPLLECDVAPDVLKNEELVPFRTKVEASLQGKTGQRGIVSVAAYFRELNDGLWFSVGDTTKFTPASLRKVPLMIALLKQAEKSGNAGFLERMVTPELAQDYNASQNIKPSQPLSPGKAYSVRELIFRMIVFSDNNAFTALTGLVDPAELDLVYVKLRMLNPEVPKDDEFLSVQTYASFFRILYNATYLNRENSEWALETLAQSEFNNGLVSGVPSEVIVAHKFGEKTDAAAGTVQLHDCGIVYYPQHPYLLCVMSKGTSFGPLDEVIRDTSRIVFEEIDAQHRKH